MVGGGGMININIQIDVAAICNKLLLLLIAVYTIMTTYHDGNIENLLMILTELIQ